MWREERSAWIEGYVCVAGIDEAGRGPLAGPVVAGCVVFPRCVAPDGIADSKTLAAAERERLLPEIVRLARGVGVGIVDVETIDRINILRASHEAMRLALADLPGGLDPDIALIDGLPALPFPIDQVAIVRGDSLSVSIAAASIVAKVTRDRIMVELDARFPGYGFAAHKGYGTPAHLEALRTLGPSPIHRRSFEPVASLVGRTAVEPGNLEIGTAKAKPGRKPRAGK